MDKILMFMFAALLAISLDCCVAETYTANIDNFNIQVTSDEPVEFLDLNPPTSYPDFTAYLVNMWVGDDLFEMIIQDYGSNTSVSKDALVSAIETSYPVPNENRESWSYTDVGGQKGIIAYVQPPGSIPQFQIAYSPDAYRNQGTIIVAITAFTADEKKVEDVLKTLQISKA